MLSIVYAQLVPANDFNQLSDLEPIFANTVRAIIPFAGILLFLMIIIGGYLYMSAGSDPQKTGIAKQTLTYAIIGTVLVASAYLILRLIATFTGVVGILNFAVGI